jgi:prolyl-tRNA synthetase
MELNIEVLYDDRVVSAGVMFSDADLLGIPIRVISSPRNVSEGCCEIITRDKTYKEKVPIEGVLSTVLGLV